MEAKERRQHLVNQLQRKGISDTTILTAINAVPRHLFVPEELQAFAYDDTALPIGHEVTISQPYVVAKMTGLLLAGKKLNKILEIGTGSGYQAAILSQLVNEVFTIERIETILKRTQKLLSSLNYENIHTLYADGNAGWSENAPFDAIIVTAATDAIPIKLLEQLKTGGRMIIPIGDPSHQELQLITKRQKSFDVRKLDPVIFVPLKPGTQ